MLDDLYSKIQELRYQMSVVERIAVRIQSGIDITTANEFLDELQHDIVNLQDACSAIPAEVDDGSGEGSGGGEEGEEGEG